MTRTLWPGPAGSASAGNLERTIERAFREEAGSLLVGEVGVEPTRRSRGTGS